MPPVWAREEQGVMAMEGYSTFPKISGTRASLSDCLVLVIGRGSLSSTETQLVYSIASANRAERWKK